MAKLAMDSRRPRKTRERPAITPRLEVHGAFRGAKVANPMRGARSRQGRVAASRMNEPHGGLRKVDFAPLGMPHIPHTSPVRARDLPGLSGSSARRECRRPPLLLCNVSSECDHG